VRLTIGSKGEMTFALRVLKEILPL
jgi:hypothetical protein